MGIFRSVFGKIVVWETPSIGRGIDISKVPKGSYRLDDGQPTRQEGHEMERP
ncbi:MAG: hypothetical protein QOJ41_1687 [Acidobacteriaceae bacterium]|jgi:hypothetical protein|nr:hypothetical protein [Acidobacteriaceae bacterium]